MEVFRPSLSDYLFLKKNIFNQIRNHLKMWEIFFQDNARITC